MKARRRPSPLQGLHLVWEALRARGPAPSQGPAPIQGPAPSQRHHGLRGHAGELEGEGPVEDHDDDAEDPLKDSRGVLEEHALLQEEHAA